MEWSSELNIGIDRIDKQHKELFKRANSLVRFLEDHNKNEILSQKKLKGEIEDLFYFLTDYCITHFNDEEALQEEILYPNYKRHKKEHDDFVKRINKLKYSFFDEITEKSFLIEEIKEEIFLWLGRHISKEDKKIAKYINFKE